MNIFKKKFFYHLLCIFSIPIINFSAEFLNAERLNQKHNNKNSFAKNNILCFVKQHPKKIIGSAAIITACLCFFKPFGGGGGGTQNNRLPSKKPFSTNENEKNQNRSTTLQQDEKLILNRQIPCSNKTLSQIPNQIDTTDYTESTKLNTFTLQASEPAKKNQNDFSKPDTTLLVKNFEYIYQKNNLNALLDGDQLSDIPRIERLKKLFGGHEFFEILNNFQSDLCKTLHEFSKKIRGKFFTTKNFIQQQKDCIKFSYLKNIVNNPEKNGDPDCKWLLDEQMKTAETFGRELAKFYDNLTKFNNSLVNNIYKDLESFIINFLEKTDAKNAYNRLLTDTGKNVIKSIVFINFLRYVQFHKFSKNFTTKDRFFTDSQNSLDGLHNTIMIQIDTNEKNTIIVGADIHSTPILFSPVEIDRPLVERALNINTGSSRVVQLGDINGRATQLGKRKVNEESEMVSFTVGGEMLYIISLYAGTLYNFSAKTSKLGPDQFCPGNHEEKDIFRQDDVFGGLIYFTKNKLKDPEAKDCYQKFITLIGALSGIFSEEALLFKNNMLMLSHSPVGFFIPKKLTNKNFIKLSDTRVQVTVEDDPFSSEQNLTNIRAILDKNQELIQKFMQTPYYSKILGNGLPKRVDIIVPINDDLFKKPTFFEQLCGENEKGISSVPKETIQDFFENKLKGKNIFKDFINELIDNITIKLTVSKERPGSAKGVLTFISKNITDTKDFLLLCFYGQFILEYLSLLYVHNDDDMETCKVFSSNIIQSLRWGDKICTLAVNDENVCLLKFFQKQERQCTDATQYLSGYRRGFLFPAWVIISAIYAERLRFPDETPLLQKEMIRKLGGHLHLAYLNHSYLENHIFSNTKSSDDAPVPFFSNTKFSDDAPVPSTDGYSNILDLANTDDTWKKHLNNLFVLLLPPINPFWGYAGGDFLPFSINKITDSTRNSTRNRAVSSAYTIAHKDNKIDIKLFGYGEKGEIVINEY